jgi:hypothetical protein
MEAVRSHGIIDLFRDDRCCNFKRIFIPLLGYYREGLLSWREALNVDRKVYPLAFLLNTVSG